MGLFSFIKNRQKTTWRDDIIQNEEKLLEIPNCNNKTSYENGLDFQNKRTELKKTQRITSSCKEEFDYNPKGISSIKEAFSCPTLTIKPTEDFQETKDLYMEREKRWPFDKAHSNCLLYRKKDKLFAEGIAWYDCKDDNYKGDFRLHFPGGKALNIPNVISFNMHFYFEDDGASVPRYNYHYYNIIFDFFDLEKVVFYIFQIKDFNIRPQRDCRTDPNCLCDLLIYKGAELIDKIENVYPAIKLSACSDPGHFLYLAERNKQERTAAFLYNYGERHFLGLVDDDDIYKASVAAVEKDYQKNGNNFPVNCQNTL